MYLNLIQIYKLRILICCSPISERIKQVNFRCRRRFLLYTFIEDMHTLERKPASTSVASVYLK